MARAEGQYTYVIRLYGGQAKADALRIRREIETSLAEAEQQLAQKIDVANKSITSQTRRLGNNRKRIEEVTRIVENFAKTWMATTKAIEQGGEGAFDELVNDAQEAYDKLVGHSIFPQLLVQLKRIFDQIGQASTEPFEEMAQAAQAAAQQTIDQIEGVVGARGQMTWPSGTELEGTQLGGRFAKAEDIERYNQGLLRLSDIQKGLPTPVEDASRSIDKQSGKVAEASNVWGDFADRLNAATLQFFGLRRLGYGLEQFGGQLAAAGEQNIQALSNWASMYGDFNEESTRAAAAMEMTAEQQQMLEETVLANVDAMRLFSPEEITDGLRAWAAGTGAVVRTQEELNEVLEQTTDVQILAALGGEELEETMRNVGGAMAEYGLTVQDVDRITAIYNFTAAKTFAEVSDVGAAFRMVGPLAKTLGVSIEETASAVGMLADENIKGTMAGRALRQTFIQLVRPSSDHTKAMNDALGLSEALGQSWQDMVFPEGKFIGLAKYIDILAAATENLTEHQRAELLATIATANALPALVALVDAQVDAREDGINVMRAWTKWSAGTYDEEVEAFRSYMERTRGIEIDISTSAYTLWDQQSELFYNSESAKLHQYEQEWRTIQIRLGKIVLDKGAPIIDKMLELLEKLADFAEAHPQLVEGAIIAAGAELVLGNLIKTAGLLVGAAANFLILRGAFKGFAGSTSIFAAAVNQFAASVGVEAAAGGGAAATGWRAVLAGILPWVFKAAGPVIGGHVAFQGESRMMADMRAIFEGLAQMMSTPELLYLQELAKEGFGARRDIGWMGGIQRILEGDVPNDWAVILQDMLNQGVISMERYVELSKELAVACEGARNSLLGFELPSVFEDAADMDLFTLPAGGVGGLTEEQLEAVELYDQMAQRLEDLTSAYAERRQDLIDNYNERELQYQEDYLDRRQDLIDNYHEREADYYQKHLQKLEDLQSTYGSRLADQIEKFQDSLDNIWQKAAERTADAQADTQRQLEKAQEDHLKKMQRLEEDHQDNLLDLAIRRDAYGIYKEMRDYGKRKSRAIEDQEERLEEIKEKGKLRLDEIQKQAAREEAKLRESHAKKLKDLEEWLAEQLKKEKESYKDSSKERAKDNKKRLADLDEQYEKQRKKRQDAYEDELDDLQDKFQDEFDEIQTSMTEELAMLLGYYADATEDYEEYLQGRLDLLELYLQRNRELWEQEPPMPVPDPSAPDPYGYESIGFPSDLFDPAAVQSRTVIVKGDFSMKLSADRNMAGVLPAGALEAELQGVFDHVHRQLEVSFG